jgi:chaperonin cofactor prefoldin
VSDREKLSEDIEKTITTLKEHEQRLVVQEETLRTQYDQMVKQFEGS